MTNIYVDAAKKLGKSKRIEGAYYFASSDGLFYLTKDESTRILIAWEILKGWGYNKRCEAMVYMSPDDIVTAFLEEKNEN